MNTSYFSSMRAFSTVALAAVCLFAFSATSYAGKPRHHKHHKHHHSRVIRDYHPPQHYYRGVVRRPSYVYPSSRFVITLGNGYGGRGYYYGPPNRGYYNRGSGVVFYSRRSSVPSRYW